jgi:hypothetical protein
MWKNLGLAAAISLMAAAPAWAEGSCGDEPIPPEIPSAAEIGQKSPTDALKAKHQAFEDIKQWQLALRDFRNCLDSDEATIKRDRQNAASQAKPDQDKLKRLDGEVAADEKANSHSTDTEERVVNDFHALSTAYCSRADVDKTSCPKT